MLVDIITADRKIDLIKTTTEALHCVIARGTVALSYIEQADTLTGLDVSSRYVQGRWRRRVSPPARRAVRSYATRARRRTRLRNAPRTNRNSAILARWHSPRWRRRMRSVTRR